MNYFSGDRKLFVNRCSRTLWLLPLLVPTSAGAQTTPAPASPTPATGAPAATLAPAPLPVVKPELAPFNVLILALDPAVLERSFLPPAPVPAQPAGILPSPAAVPGMVPAGTATAGIAPAALATPPRTPVGAIVPVTPAAAIAPRQNPDQGPDRGAIVPAPILPAPLVPPGQVGAITPAAFLQPGIRVLALAQKKPDKDDHLFRLEPDHTGAAARVPAGPDRANPAGTELTPLPAPLPFVAPLAAAPAGNAQLAAFPLRRALLANGFPDVMTAGPDAPAVTRIMGEKRLTPRVLENLRLAMLGMQANSSPRPDLKSAILAASRVGQAVGYRAVVVLTVTPGANKALAGEGSYTMLLVDALRETGEPILFDEKGADLNALREAGASTGAAFIEKAVRSWPANFSPAERSQLARKHFEAAQAAYDGGRLEEAQDEVNQAITLDSSRGEAYILLGDVLQKADPAAAAVAYRRAVDLNARDAATWAKIATAATTSAVPDWPRALDAGRRALALGLDTVSLRVAMATAQFGRADIFRKNDRLEKAEDAEFEARQHLDKALEQGPDDPNVVRLLTRQLIAQRQFEVAVQTLDRVAPRYPRDIEIQSQYATALSRMEGREEDAFVISARVWKLSGTRVVDTDIVVYRRLAEGFDRRLFNLGKNASQLTTGVANAALPREAALLQLTRLKEDMNEANSAINLMRAPAGVTADVAGARTFAADLMNQALEKHQVYLETGQEIFRVRALELYRQAVGQLNTARSAK